MLLLLLFIHSVVSNSLQPHGLQHPRPPWSITNSQTLLKLMSIESVMPSNRLILCRPLLLPPSIFPSIRVFPMSQLFASGGQSIKNVSGKKINCIRRLDSAAFLLSCSSGFSLTPSHTFSVHDSLHPSLLFAFPNLFLPRTTVFQLAAWTPSMGRRCRLAASASVAMKTCFPLCIALRAISTPATVPGEIPPLAHVEDGSSGGDRLHRGKGERKTCVVSAAFTLAEKNGCETGAGVQSLQSSGRSAGPA